MMLRLIVGLGLLAALVLPVRADDSLDLAPATCRAEVRMYTTLATWCEGCRNEIARLRHLSRAFSTEELAMFGLPVDEKDDATLLRRWMDDLDPPYELLDELSKKQIDELKARLLVRLGAEVLPATILTDRRGRVLAMMAGAPTVSRIREILFCLEPGRTESTPECSQALGSD
jgi:peroxiredoxin